MSHDRGGSDQGGNPPRRPLAGGRAWWKGCRAWWKGCRAPQSMVKTRYHRSTGLRPFAKRRS